MSVVGGPVVRRTVEVSQSSTSQEELLASVGLSAEVDTADWMREAVDAEAFFGLLERATPEDDHGLPFRYGEAVRVDDFAALGLALKTASTLRDALVRLTRYILVLSDTVEYELQDEVGGAAFVLIRPSHRRGAHLANECAMAAVTSILRQIAPSRVNPVLVSFKHSSLGSDEPHRTYFDCPVRFDDRVNALHLSTETLRTRTRLGDEGLSAFLLAQLDEMKREAEPDLETLVYRAVTDSLPDGRASKPQIARRLGMSERTLHRRLAEQGKTFQTIVSDAQRDAAASLLAQPGTSLAEVAFLTGFSDQSAFTRAFKGWTGQTPLSFRERAAEA